MSELKEDEIKNKEAEAAISKKQRLMLLQLRWEC